jgi:proteasome lid subunit RPN8/RPN11
VLDGIFSECQKHSPKETIGFLVGMYCRWKERDGDEYLYFTLVDGYIPVGGASSEYHVIMDAESIASAIQKLEKNYNDGKHSIVGWYHSHPGYGVFLSDIDVKSQITFFNQPHHVALVVDPVRNKFGFFKLSLYNEPVLVSYAIWREVGER